MKSIKVWVKFWQPSAQIEGQNLIFLEIKNTHLFSLNNLKRDLATKVDPFESIYISWSSIFFCVNFLKTSASLHTGVAPGLLLNMCIHFPGFSLFTPYSQAWPARGPVPHVGWWLGTSTRVLSTCVNMELLWSEHMFVV